MSATLDGSSASGHGGSSRDIVEDPPLVKALHKMKMRYQHYMDKSIIWTKGRWGVFFGLLVLYVIRVALIQGFYIVTYGLGIYLLNLLIGFLTPQVDPDTDGPLLPTNDGEEFRPFARRLPEFKAWSSGFHAVVVAIFMTFFKFFDLPVFWPILLLYFIMLFFLTMKQQIKHMVKYKYVPWSVGKRNYNELTKLKPPPTIPGPAPGGKSL